MHILKELCVRILAGAAVLWAAASLAFAVLQLFPSDPVQVIYGADSSVTPELRNAIRADFGLDQPVWVQYQRFVTRIAQGDLGISYQQRRTVASIIGSEIGATLTLASLSVSLALVMACLSSLFTAGRRSWLRRTLSAFELFSVSTPVLWIGILLLTFFSFQWQLFPVVADEGWRSLVLPVVTLALGIFAGLAQVMREEMDVALEQPFTLTARTRGLSERAIRWRHAFRHALIPGITISTEMFGGLLAGSIVTEQVFGRPGLGRITLEAITNHDIPVVLGIILLVAFVFVTLNILADLLYRLVDPRLRLAAS